MKRAALADLIVEQRATIARLEARLDRFDEIGAYAALREELANERNRHTEFGQRANRTIREKAAEIARLEAERDAIQKQLDIRIAETQPGGKYFEWVPDSEMRDMVLEFASDLAVAEEERDALAKVIADAPHAEDCALADWWEWWETEPPDIECDCWKASVPK
jgi:hypothetical protein